MSLPKYLSELSPRMLALVFFGIVFGGSCLVMSYLYLGAIEHRESDTRIYVRELAMAVAGLVDVELHEQLVRPEQLDSEEYRRLLRPLVKFHLAHPNVQYLWTTRVAGDGRQLFLLETSTDVRIRAQQSGLGRKQDLLQFLDPDPPTAAGEKSIPALRNGEALVLDGVYSDSHGEYIEARAPLMDREGRFVGYLGVDYALDSYRQQINEVRFAGLVTLVLALVVSLLVAGVMAEMRGQTFAQITQIQQAEAEMRAQRDRASQATEAKGELLRIASHDLKNPLTAIAGMSGLLLKMMKTRPDQTALKDDLEVLDSIHASARHMSDIVRGLLMSEGLEQGGLPFTPVATDLGQLCAKVLRFNAPAAKGKNITVHEEIATGLIALVDAKLMHEAFDNYVSNAVKYSPLGRAITVTLAAVAADGWEFSVRDQGPGLSVEDQAKLFQKFKKLTPRPTGGESSTGLGLSIVKTIAGLHHGEVGCESEVGQGSRFWLRAPLRPPGA